MLLVGMQNGAATLEKGLAVSFNVKHMFYLVTHWSLSQLFKWTENLHSQKLVHKRVLTVSLTIAKTWRQLGRAPVGEMVNGLWRIRATEYHPATRRDGLTTHVTTWTRRPCIGLSSERSQLQKAMSYLISFIWHSGKGKTTGTENRSGAAST